MRMVVTCALVSSVLFGCGSGAPAATAADASVPTGADDAAMVARPDLSTMACTDTDGPDGGVCPLQVTGHVVDDSGKPFKVPVVSLCAGLCFFGTTSADGSFSVAADLHILPDLFAVELHGRPDHFSYYTPLPARAGATVTFVMPLFLPSLPASGPEILGDGSAQTLTSSDVTLTLPMGTTVQFDVEDFGIPGGHQLRVLPIADTSKLPFIDSKSPPAALYALSPFEAGLTQKASVSIANRAKLPAGAAVDIQSMGGLLNDVPPAGHFHHVAAAHVSMDGATIASDPGEGISELTWLAVFKQ